MLICSERTAFLFNKQEEIDFEGVTSASEGIFSPDLSVVECERDNVVKHEVRVLQVNLASSLNNDEVLDWWKPFSVRQLHTESQGVWLSTSSDDEVLKYTSSIKTD